MFSFFFLRKILYIYQNTEDAIVSFLIDLLCYMSCVKGARGGRGARGPTGKPGAKVRARPILEFISMGPVMMYVSA